MSVSEGACFAHILERLTRDVLFQLEDVPEADLNRQLELPETNTLFALATHLVGAAEYWVLALVGQRQISRDRAAEFQARGSFSELQERYDRWLQAMHEVLDALADNRLQEPVSQPTSYRYAPPDRPLIVRDALLHAVEHCALHLGHIQLTRQLLGLPVRT
ncbi:DinB family protein [Thermogemmatispora sp.]|uniref:DinB family protein n=1 Tax=Thermogemmatispora sp. TaxID=1968838 RepID=UPI001D3E8592|nr:DinB family protein [Thermogemmatispora sp.]MBX5450739.1 DinB family protein [Thermogemmatispora sp.]